MGLKTLRPYQEKAISAVMSAYNRGITKALLVMATGTGKTLTTIKLIERMGFQRVLFLSDRENLVIQSGMAFIKDKFDSDVVSKIESKGFLEWVRESGGKLPSYQIGVIKADIWQPEGDIIMGSLQTLCRRIGKLRPDYFDCIVVDEAHGYASVTAVKTLASFTPKLLLGLTGSPYRADGLPLSDIFQEIVYEYDIAQGIKDGYLCELEGIRVKTNISLDKVHTLGGEFNQGELVQEVNIPERNKLVIESFIKYCGGRQAIGYAVNIQHAVDLAAIFNDYGVRSVAISSNEELTPDSRQKLQDYSAGKYQVIWNVAMIVQGYDAPETGSIIWAAPTKSLTKYLQGTGRGTRLKSKGYVDKYGQKAIILDIIDNTVKHNLINTWTLDKGKSTEDRVFTTREQKDAVLAQIEAKKATIQATRKEDEKVNLLTIPKLKLVKTYNTSKDATPAQLAVIERWGYNIKDNHYTHYQISEIFGAQPASYAAIKEMESWGYQTNVGFISISQYQLAKKEYESRKNATKAKY
jgi:superfamily II DNA or RNA helicase